MDQIYNAYNSIILESNVGRILNYIKNFECACISGSRNKLTNITDKTLLDITPEQQYTKEQNRHRNSILKACLLKLGYGVTSLDGKYAEAGEMFPGKETSYFVVNISDDSNFYNNLFKLSEKFNQDSFLYKPIDTINGTLVGTNNAQRNEEFKIPGYNQTINVGEFHPNGFEGALSKIGNHIFQFRLNPNKEQNKQFIGKEILSEEIFDRLSINQKSGCLQTFKKYFN